MVKKINVMIIMILTIVFLSSCKSNDNEYDEIIDQVFEEVQKFNDDEDYLYIHGGREESNIYIYEAEGMDDEGLIIRVYYPYEEKRTGKKRYDEDWYVKERNIKEIQYKKIDLHYKTNLELKYEENNIEN